MDVNPLSLLIPAPREAASIGADAGQTFGGFFDSLAMPETAIDIPAFLQQIERRIAHSDPGHFAFVYTLNAYRCHVFGIRDLADFDLNASPLANTVGRAFRFGLKEAQNEIGQGAVFAGGVLKLGAWLHRVRPGAIGMIDISDPYQIREG
jgi:hypothetical protein